jgi:hypothetical protein
MKDKIIGTLLIASLIYEGFFKRPYNPSEWYFVNSLFILSGIFVVAVVFFFIRPVEPTKNEKKEEVMEQKVAFALARIDQIKIEVEGATWANEQRKMDGVTFVDYPSEWFFAKAAEIQELIEKYLV